MPQMQFSTLVLPAPFGPMRASSSPASTVNDTPSRTFGPPNARWSARSSSSAIPASRAAVLLDLAIAAARARAAEIELGDIRVRAQALRCAVEHHPAVLHHITIVGDIECHARVLLDEENRHAELAPYGLQALHQLLDEQRREALRQLIDEQQPRLAHQRGADRQHLALPAGEPPPSRGAKLGEPRKEFVYAPGEPAPVGARPVRGFEVVRNRKVLEHLVALGDEHDAARGDAMRRLALDALAFVADRALGHLRIIQADEAGDRAQRRRLAGAVG